MKKVLVTGAGGFIGAYLSHFLAGKGYEVGAGLRQGGTTWRLQGAPFKLVEFDIASLRSVDAAFSSFKPDLVVNCAAYGAYPTQQNPKLIRLTNIAGLENIIAASKKHGVEKLIQTGTSSEYGVAQQPMKETDPVAPYSEYAKTKVQATAIALKAGSPEFQCAVIRPFSAFGDYEDKKRLVPTLILSALAGKPAALSSPTPVRDFVYIEDVARGYLAVLESSRASGEIFNIGCGRQYSVGDAAALVNRLVPGSPPPRWNSVENRRIEPAFWMADISKAKRLLGWEPNFSFEKGMAKSIGWFSAHAALYEKAEAAHERAI